MWADGTEFVSDDAGSAGVWTGGIKPNVFSAPRAEADATAGCNVGGGDLAGHEGAGRAALWTSLAGALAVIGIILTKTRR